MYEVRSYILGESGDAAAVETYLGDVLAPAMQRQQIGPIGLFTNADSDQSGSQRIVMVIAVDNASELVKARKGLAADKVYQSDAKTYLDREATDAPYQRIQSELLVAMDCMPKLQVPEETLQNDDRIYELRVYESPTERLGDLKVEMFNEGEVPIFFESEVTPVFIGQTLIGPQMPSLTYLTVYQNEIQRAEAWAAFRAHPDWLVLSKMQKYQKTVSHIDKFVLRPLPASQM